MFGASLTLAGENRRVNSEFKYSPKEGFVKSRNGESARGQCGRPTPMRRFTFWAWSSRKR